MTPEIQATIDRITNDRIKSLGIQCLIALPAIMAVVFAAIDSLS